MDAWPSVSVIIPARNSEPTISEALDGVYGQEYPGPLEVCCCGRLGRRYDGPAHNESLSEVRIVPNPTGLRRTARIEP